MKIYINNTSVVFRKPQEWEVKSSGVIKKTSAKNYFSETSVGSWNADGIYKIEIKSLNPFTPSGTANLVVQEFKGTSGANLLTDSISLIGIKMDSMQTFDFVSKGSVVSDAYVRLYLDDNPDTEFEYTLYKHK